MKHAVKSRLRVAIMLVVAIVFLTSCAGNGIGAGEASPVATQSPASSDQQAEPTSQPAPTSKALEDEPTPQQPTKLATESQPEVVPTETEAAESRPSAQETRDTYEGTPVGFTEGGYPYRGNLNAPITMIEYSDYLCGFCARHNAETLPLLMEKYVRTGDVLFVFKDFPIASIHPTASVGHMASLCVAEQGAAQYWRIHDALFATQNQWNRAQDPTAFLEELVSGLGVDMTAYGECVASGRTQERVARGIAAGEAAGFSGTPSFQFVVNESGDTHPLVGAYPVETFVQWLDALVAGEGPPQDPQTDEEPPELPYWANAEGLKPDLSRPGVTLAGDQYKGNPDAPLVVVEFGDFQCPPCQVHALQTQPVLDEAFVDTGQVMWVFKHHPLRSHPLAPVAAAAAECASDQGAFWEMHDLLFEAMDEWSTGDADANLVALAERLNLDTGVFATCLASREPLERVLLDLYDGEGVVQSTPTFVVLYGGSGTIVSGAYPAEQFVAALQNMLVEAGADGAD